MNKISFFENVIFIISFLDLQNIFNRNKKQILELDSMSILICDDNEDLREILSVILKDKYEVITAKDGLEGVTKFIQHRPKVVLMDLKMPEMDGIEATKRISEMEPDTCIIGFTAYATTKAKEFFNAGLKGIIEKPIKMSRLVEQINIICNVQNFTDH